MDISHLKTFIEIYKSRHFRKTAEKLFITQSAASARIKLLEDNLGVQLFSRDKRNIQPTSAAHRFYKYAELVVNNWDQGKQIVSLPDDYEKSLSIACMADIWHLFLNEHIVEIENKYPELALNLTINQAPNISDKLVNGSLDLGLVFEAVHFPNLDIEEILSFPIKLFSTKENQTTEEALNDNYLMIDWGVSFAYEYSQKYADHSTPSISTNYGVMALDILKGQGGSAYLPDVELLKLDPNLKLYEVDDAFSFNRSLYALYRKDSESQKEIFQIIKSIKNIVN